MIPDNTLYLVLEITTSKTIIRCALTLKKKTLCYYINY